MSVKDRKLEPPRPEDQPSPVLFLVTSQMLPSVSIIIRLVTLPNIEYAFAQIMHVCTIRKCIH